MTHASLAIYKRREQIYLTFKLTPCKLRFYNWSWICRQRYLNDVSEIELKKKKKEKWSCCVNERKSYRASSKDDDKSWEVNVCLKCLESYFQESIVINRNFRRFRSWQFKAVNISFTTFLEQSKLIILTENKNVQLRSCLTYI